MTERDNPCVGLVQCLNRPECLTASCSALPAALAAESLPASGFRSNDAGKFDGMLCSFRPFGPFAAFGLLAFVSCAAVGEGVAVATGCKVFSVLSSGPSSTEIEVGAVDCTVVFSPPC